MSEQERVYQSSFDLFAPGAALFQAQPVPEAAAPEPEEETSAGLPRGDKPEGYSIYIFTKSIPDRQTTRAYYIVYQPSLWDEYTVQRQWGLVGSEHQQFHTEHFRSPRPALARIRHLVNRRLRRGYRLSYAA